MRDNFCGGAQEPSPAFAAKIQPDLSFMMVQRHVAEAIAAALDPSPALPEDVDHICRLLLAADRYEVAHLRAFCLHRLALMFERLSSTTANAKSRAIFEVMIN